MTDEKAPTHPRRRKAGVVAVLATAALLLAACAAGPVTGNGGGPPPAPVPSAAGATVTSTALPAGAEHVHALAVTRSGRVLAATHSGLFSVSTTGNARLGRLTADLDGLAVSDDDIYISAHAAGVTSSRLGLLRSEDGGRSWSSVVGSGRAHLDTLAVRGATIVGEEGGRLWISTDRGRGWRSTASPAAVSLTLDSRDLWLTGWDGLSRARVDGSGLHRVTDAPEIYRGALGRDKAVWGMGKEGDVWLRVGDRWREAATLPAGTTVTAGRRRDARRRRDGPDASVDHRLRRRSPPRDLLHVGRG